MWAMTGPWSPRFPRVLVVFGVAALIVWLMHGDGDPDPGIVMTIAEHGGEALSPLPLVPNLPPEKVALGRALFSDVRLSHDNTLSCASCHDLATAGHDRRKVSVGVAGAVGSINAPSVFNATLNFVQFWDGRAETLEDQVSGPVHNPVEMASSWPEAIAKLNEDEKFRREFTHAYPNGIEAASLVDAIATFERTLLTQNAPFDRFLRGDLQAIDARAQLGYRRFRELGCVSCHQGVNFGGNMFQRFGVMTDYFGSGEAHRAATSADLGRFNVTGCEEDRYVFKVPSLRNVALTAPYFHDGSAATLDEAVAVMGRVQLGRELSTDEIDSVKAFLGTLTGERPTSLAQ
jgi:cytochrome c peroxidase